MSPRLARATSRLLAMLFVGLLLARASMALAAAPEYVWVVLDDDTSVLLSSFEENAVVLNGDRIEERPEGGRPRYELFLYWGSDWRTETDKHSEILARNLAAANQQGYLYPAHRGQPALLVLEMPEGGSSVVELSEPAVALLEARGIPMSVSDAGGWVTDDRALIAAGLVIIVILVLGRVAIRFRVNRESAPTEFAQASLTVATLSRVARGTRHCPSRTRQSL